MARRNYGNRQRLLYRMVAADFAKLRQERGREHGKEYCKVYAMLPHPAAFA
jgi:hypothetical protein